jgi:enamine deaminase RidA (YjgF/YER057c/UK114 family)
MSADAKLAELKLELPPAPEPMGVYKPLVIVGNMAYVSGHGPLKPDRTLTVGRVGVEAEVDTLNAVVTLLPVVVSGLAPKMGSAPDGSPVPPHMGRR